ncbi:MAG: isocitrate/isopropylmalate family dehydrogenase, partial [Candidatus Bathyarchaeia archaeon]
MVSYKIPVIPGDGIGPEVVAEGIKVLETVSEVKNFEIEWLFYPYGADHYLKTGELLPESALEEMSKHKVIYFGAIGDPRVPPGILEKGILLAIRFQFDQYINLRPIQLMEGVPTPLKDKTYKDVDFVVIRENTEDMYVGLGSRAKKGKSKFEHSLIRNL